LPRVSWFLRKRRQPGIGWRHWAAKASKGSQIAAIAGVFEDFGAGIMGMGQRNDFQGFHGFCASGGNRELRGGIGRQRAAKGRK